VRAVPILAVIVALAILLSGCGGDENTLESLAGTPASTHIVKDVEAMAHACAQKSQKTRQAGIEAYTNLAKITSIHPNATFGPEENAELTMRQLLRRTVEKTGHCIGVSVDSKGQFHAD
jgi:PBP1b-binding outer membrane lipoprotein LpoB